MEATTQTQGQQTAHPSNRQTEWHRKWEECTTKVGEGGREGEAAAGEVVNDKRQDTSELTRAILNQAQRHDHFGEEHVQLEEIEQRSLKYVMVRDDVKDDGSMVGR